MIDSQMTRRAQSDEIGSGIFSRICAVVYRYLVLAIFLALTCAPTVAAWTVLEPAASNGVLFVAAMLPVAPALSAGVYAMRHWDTTTDQSPLRALCRGYVRNLIDTLKWWLIVLAIAAVLVINLQFGRSVPGGAALRLLFVVLLVVLAVWSGHLLVVTSLFSFRTRDALRIAAAEAFAQWRASLGFLALLIVAAAVVVIGSEAILLLATWAFTAVIWLTARPVVADVAARFVRHG